MNRQGLRAAVWPAVLALGFASSLATAIPKAAEHDDAPVTYGADAPRPKMGQGTKKVEPKKTPRAKSGAAQAKHRAAPVKPAKSATAQKRRK